MHPRSAHVDTIHLLQRPRQKTRNRLVLHHLFDLRPRHFATTPALWPRVRILLAGIHVTYLRNAKAAVEFLFERWKLKHRLAPFLIMRAAVPYDVVTKKRFPSVTHTSALLSPKEKPVKAGSGWGPRRSAPAYHSSSLREVFSASSLVPVLFFILRYDSCG